MIEKDESSIEERSSQDGRILVREVVNDGTITAKEWNRWEKSCIGRARKAEQRFAAEKAEEEQRIAANVTRKGAEKDWQQIL